MITVFGLGFVGLTTALGFAHYGYKVYGIDTNQERKELLKNNKLPFFEPDMDQILIEENNKNFFITEDVGKAIKESQYIFYCVGTPYGENGEADLTYLFQAIETTLDCLKEEQKKILIVKSTIPPSTTQERIIPFIEIKGYRVNEDIYVANNPEFLREGYCWEDFINADRIVIGCENEFATNKIKEIYKPFNIPIFELSYNSGEFIKYLSNTMLATMISFANEMANVADQIGGIDISKAFRVIHMDKRWGNGTMSSYFYPGCGYGGYCLPKDTNALYALAKQKGYEAEILSNVIKLNNNMVNIITDKIKKQVDKNTKIGVLGLSFKADSNDVRESVSAKVIEKLISEAFDNISAYDPKAITEFKEHYNFPITYYSTLEEICNETEVLIILTGWEEFINIKKITNKRILDYRYIT